MAKTGERQITDIATIPFVGGMDTRRERAALRSGAYSDIQNIRHRHTGFEQRKGMKRKHTVSDPSGTPKNQAMSLYQFSKGRTTERHFFSQMSDGDVLKATDAPPTVTTGAFGAEFHSGTTKANGMLPASWSDVNDIMVYSNGKEQHQVYAGDDNYVWGLVKYDHPSAAPPNIPTDGFDYTLQVTDGLTTTGATLDDLDTLAAFECLFICTPVPATKLTWTFSGTKVNTAAAVGTLSYRKSDSSWADTTETDGTITGGDTTLGQSGSMTWSEPSDEIPCFMYGQSGYWYQWKTGTKLTDAGAGITVTSLTYGHNAEFVDITNVWDGTLEYVTEAQHFDNSETTNVHSTYPGDNIILSELEHTNDKLYFSFPDPLEGVYVDVGIAPNKPAGATAITAIYYWDGDSWASVGTVTDETNGFINSGWITWAQKSSQPHQFNGSRHYAYWYYIVFGTASFSDGVSVAMFGMPYFDISELGNVSLASCSWKGRCAMTFDKYPSYVYLPSNESPLMLNGPNYGILQAGDGRNNRAVAMRRFYNEMIVWQQEKGLDGGCTTLFQGYSPDTYGKLVLSSTVGTFSNKSVVVVDGVQTSEQTEKEVKSMAFWLSNYGVIASDGRAVSIISDQIQNYFDPADSNSLRRGYDKEHWIGYDSMYNCLRVGLVTGSSSAIPNIFLVFDLVEGAWSHDELFTDDATAGLSCVTEVEAASGDIPILQYGGGVDDGCIYQLNTGTDDLDIAAATHAIDAYATMELSNHGKVFQVGRLVLRTKVQSAGNVTVTPSKNGVEKTALGALSMTASNTNELMRRNRTKVGTQDSNVSLKFQNATAGQSMYLLDVGVEILEKPTR